MIRWLLNKLAGRNGQDRNGDDEAAVAEEQVAAARRRLEKTNGDFDRRCTEVRKKLEEIEHPD